VKTFVEGYSRHSALLALALQIRQDLYDSVLQMAAHLRTIYGFSDDCPPGMDVDFHEQACEFLAALTDPAFATRVSETSLLSQDFSSQTLQTMLRPLLPGLSAQGSRVGGPSAAEASTSASPVAGPSGSVFSPQSPPAKRRRRTTVTPAGTAMEGVTATSSTFPLVPVSFAPSPAMGAGPSLPPAGRVSRSASRGSGHLSTSGSQTDLKRKRRGGGK
jgi:hypothetical protein